MLNRPPQPRPPRIAYLMSWFPVVSETFILDEILELERQGTQVEIFPLFGRHTTLLHPGAAWLVARAHYTRFASLALLLAQLFWLRREPRTYLRLWWQCLFWNLRSFDFFLRSFVVIPKAALLARQMQALGITHVHAHWATHPTLAAFIVRELTGIPYSFTTHAHDLFVDRTMLDRKIAAASFVVTISDFNRRMLRDHYGEEAEQKTEVIHCGVDPAHYPLQRDRQRLAASPFTLICVATLRDYKGHPHLIEACRLLKAQGVAFRLQLIGEGEERERITQQIDAAGLTEEVQLLGAQPRDRVRAYLSAADVMVLPSVITSYGKMEGIPVSLIEAMCSGLPVIASDLSAIPELVVNSETGMLVPPGQPAAIAAAVHALMESPDLRESLAAAGREHVLRHFTLQHNVARLRARFLSLPHHLRPTSKAPGEEWEQEPPSPPSPQARQAM